MRSVFLFSLFIIVVSSGCKKLSELTRFNIDYNTTATIPSATGINLPFNIFTPDVETNSSSTFSVNNTNKDLVEEIKLSTLRLELTSPSGADFSFLKSVNIYISASGLPEVKMAWKDVVPDNAGATINLDVSSADLKEYIKKDKFSLRLNSVTDELITAEHRLNIFSTFAVDAKVLGL